MNHLISSFFCKKPCAPAASAKGQRGFTLLEMALATAVLGILTLAAVPAMRAMLTAQQNAYVNQQTNINQRIARAMLAHAENEVAGLPIGVPVGSLTAPCNNSANRVFFSPFDGTLCPTSTGSLRNYLLQEGVPLHQVALDGTGNRNVRVYQRVAGLSQEAYLFYQGGPKVFLNYDVGVIYTTNCGNWQPCNVSAASSSSPPLSQPVFANETTANAGAVRMTSSNFTTWTPGLRDVGLAYVSTLPLQTKMMRETSDHLNRVRDAFLRFYESRRLANPASTANHFPRPTDPSAQLAPVALPAGNQGCREGWYGLDTVNVDVLAQIGLGPSVEYGRTAWGASIEYCRDYDPSLTSPHGTAPHYAAIRIFRYLSDGAQPESGGIDDNNIVISF